MPSKTDCDWCHGTGFVDVWHRDYQGEDPILRDEVDREGEVHVRKVPARLTIRCRECALGAWMWERLEQADRDRLMSTEHVKSGRVPYLPHESDPCYEPPFKTFAEGIAWMRSLRGSVVQSVPDVLGKEYPR